MIVAEGLTKAFGDVVAVKDVSFDVQAGEVVALLGHDGAGKTTLLRMLVGLVRPDAGSATICGQPYAALKRPARQVGALLGTGAHPARSARDHLRIAAVRGELPAGRVDDVLALVGLQDEAAMRVRDFGRGTRRRLALATALLGEPDALLVDDAATDLGRDDARWLNELLRALAQQGCGVLVTGREISDAVHVADRVLVLERGEIIARSTPRELLRRAGSEVVVRSPLADALAGELHDVGIDSASVDGDELHVRDVPPRVVSELAAASGVPVWELRAEASSADDVLDELIDEAASQNGAGPPRGGEPADDPLAEAEASLDAALAALQTAQQARVVAVLAPGRGLGATTLAFLIADVLAASRDARTLAVALSCDHERMSRPVAGDQRTSLGLANLLDDLPDFDDRARISPYVAPAPSGADVLCGPPPDRLAAIEPAEVDALLAFAGHFYDTIVLDIGGLADPTLRAVVRRADEVVLLGAPDALDGLEAADPVLDAIEGERAERATLVFNRVEEQRIRELSDDGDGGGAFALVPRDRDLIRALDAGDFRLDGVGLPTRVALKRLALLVGERIA